MRRGGSFSYRHFFVYFQSTESDQISYNVLINGAGGPDGKVFGGLYNKKKVFSELLAVQL